MRTRHLVEIVPCLLCLAGPSVSRAFEEFYPPHLPQFTETIDLEGARVLIDWSLGGSVRTLLFMAPLLGPGEERPRIAPPLPSADAMGAWVREYVDAHPEFFAAHSDSFDFFVSPRLGGASWAANSVQHHRAVPILGSGLSISVLTDGRLFLADGCLVPTADLESLKTEPAVGAEEAAATAVETHGNDAEAFQEKLHVVFRQGRPALAWWVKLRADNGFGRRVVWWYLVAADTGDVLAAQYSGVSFSSRVFIRGDANLDGALDLSDPVAILSRLFLGAEGEHCADAEDANDDGQVDLSDAVYGLRYLFLGGNAPPAPFPRPGPDLTADPLLCPIQR